MNKITESIIDAIKVDDFQMDILKYIWHQHIKTSLWPKCYKVHQQFQLKRDEVRNALYSLGGGAVLEFLDHPDRCYYKLTALGAVIASGGELLDHSVKLIELLKKKIQDGTFRGELSLEEMREEIGCNGSDSCSLGMFSFDFLPYHLSKSPTTGEECTITYREDIDRLLSVTDARQYIENEIVGQIDLQRPFYHEDRKLYDSLVIYSPMKLNFGYNKLLKTKVTILGNLFTVSVSIVISYIIIAAWVPAIIPSFVGTNLSKALNATISIICALTGIGFISGLFYLRKKLINWLHSRSTRQALLFAKIGLFEELLEQEKHIKVIWDQLKRSDDQV